MNRRAFTTLASLSVLAAAARPVMAAKLPDTWDGLIKVPSKRLDAVYLLPGADFRVYTKVMLDPTEVAFAKNWQKDFNNSTVRTGGRITDEEAEKIAERVRTGFEEIFAKAYADAGYQIVTAPGHEVLRVRTAVANLYIAAPDQMTPGRSYSFSVEAGEATLVLEARDSVTGAILGRAVDRRLAGDRSRAAIRNSVTNQSDFEQLFRSWAKASTNGLAELKTLSPIGPNGEVAKAG